MAAPGFRAHVDGREVHAGHGEGGGEAAIRKAAQSKDNPADLINVALDELVRQRCELPGYTTLDAMAAAIRTEVNGGMFTAVAARLDPLQRARFERLLWVDPTTRRSEFDRLKDSARAAALGKFKDRLAYLADMFTVEACLRDLDEQAIASLGEFGRDDLTFAGSDANHPRESSLRSYARHVIKTGRWTSMAYHFDDQHERGNSHTQMLEQYQRMLIADKSVLARRKAKKGHNMDAYRFDVNDLREILALATT